MATVDELRAAMQTMANAIQVMAQARQLAPVTQNQGIPHFPKYTDGDNISDYCIQFEGLADVHNYNDDKKKASFLALLSATTFQLLKNLIFPETFDTRNYAQLKAALVGHLRPAPLRIPSRHELCSRKQREGENIPDYMAALRALAIPCGYNADVLKEILKDIFVAGIRSKSSLDQLFTMPDTASLEDLYAKAVAIEKAESSTLQVLNETPTPQVHAINANKPKKSFLNKSNKSKTSTSANHSKSDHYKKTSEKKVVCYSCGKPNHKSPDCRVRDTLHCELCDKDGHVSAICRYKDTSGASSARDRSSHNVHHVTSSDVNYVSHNGSWMTKVFVNNIKIDFELDTGSEFTLIPLSVFSRIKNRTRLRDTNKSFQPYGDSKPIPALGSATVSVRFRNRQERLELYVIKEANVPIMGRQWLEAMAIYKPPSDIHAVNEVSNTDLQKLKSEFETVFADGIGTAPITVSLQFKDNAQPVFRKHRSVPYALREKVEEELQRLIADGVLTPVDHSTWATPIVPVVNKSGKVRITADYSCTVNPNLLVPSFPLPRVEEQLSNIANGKLFCKLDIKKAYLCLPLDEASSSALTINTHKGLLRPTRLMFGCASAPVIWAKFIANILRELKGVAHFFDDIFLAAEDKQTLIELLREVLRRLQENGLRLNLEKCAFFVEKVDYLGYELTPEGIHPDTASIQAIRDLPEPQNADQLRKFLGMVSFYAKFFKGMAETAATLYDATKQNIRFQWTSACRRAFTKLKSELTSDRVLVPYDPVRPITLSADAGPRGLGAVLAHIYPDGSERPIVYIHKKLDKCQVNYSQIDKEALAIKWSVEKLQPYLIGREFTLVTDHQPLVHIFGPKRKKLPQLCATRLLHYALFLQDFNFNIKYRRSEEHGNADFLSRLPQHSSELQQETTQEDEVDIVQLHHISLLPTSSIQIAKDTLKDPEGRILLQKLRSGETLGDKDGLYSLQSGCVMRGLRTYIPAACRKMVLDELHNGHLGICKMKGLARSYVFWPNMDADIENVCKNCRACSLHKGRPPVIETHYWEHPKKPWERIHADFAFYGKHTYLIIVDAHSKWPEISIVPNMLASTVISEFKKLFARYGLPSCLVTDNQATFVSRELREYLQEGHVKHKTIAPYHCATNGLAERMVGALKQCLRTLQYSKGTAHENLLTFLAAYRRAPHTTTGVSPAMLFLKRELHTPLDFYQPSEAPIIAERAQKTFKDPAFKEGEKVAVRDYVNPLRKWKLGTIVARDGQLSYTVLVDGELHRKHVEQLRSVGQDVQLPAVPVVTTLPPTQPAFVLPSVAGASTPSPPSTSRQSLQYRQSLSPVPETPRAPPPPSPRQPARFNVAAAPQPATPVVAASPPLALRRQQRVRRPVDRYTPSQ